MPHNATLLYPYQRRYLADGGRFETGMWSRQTVKTLTTTPEVVPGCALRHRRADAHGAHRQERQLHPRRAPP